MSTVTPIPIAARPHRVLLQKPGPAVSDGDGGFLQTWTDLAPPAMSAEILPATAQNLERRVSAGTVTATATHVMTMPYHPQITTKVRVIYNGRTFMVTGVSNPEEANVLSVLLCDEVVA